MNGHKIAAELVKIAKSLMADATEKQYELMKEAESKGIKIEFKDKYIRGQKAIGPRNWNEVNVQSLYHAIATGRNEVVLWRG